MFFVLKPIPESKPGWYEAEPSSSCRDANVQFSEELNCLSTQMRVSCQAHAGGDLFRATAFWESQKIFANSWKFSDMGCEIFSPISRPCVRVFIERRSNFQEHLAHGSVFDWPRLSLWSDANLCKNKGKMSGLLEVKWIAFEALVYVSEWRVWHLFVWSKLGTPSQRNSSGPCHRDCQDKSHGV